METICIIPTQGGSNGIPVNHISDFCRKPLLAWSIFQAQQARAVNAVYVTSDDEAILRVAEDFGAKCIRQSDVLSSNNVTLEAAILNAIKHIEKERAAKIDVVVILKATSPLREAEDIDGAIQKLINKNADSLFSSARLEDFFIWQETKEGLKSLNFDYTRRRCPQGVKPQYVENKSIYLFKPDVLRTTNNCLGGRIATYEMSYWKTRDINSMEDKAICEWYFRTRLMKRFVNLTPTGIDLIVYDFDGVMTDNRALTLQDGTEAVFVNRADGLGVAMIKESGIHQLILTTESNPVVEARAAKIGLPVIYNASDKRTALESYCRTHAFDSSRVVYVGNDINDKEAMQFVGIPIAPADAHPEILRIACIVVDAIGGGGVVRELANMILFKSTSGRAT